jgi:DNA-binding MarR family transcriptional regulator
MASSPEIRAAIRLLEAFKRVDPEMTLPTMLTFLYVVERDGQSGNQSEVEQRLNMTGATTSRSISNWLEYKSKRIPGHNMMESIPDPEDRRYRMITLNHRGMALVEKIKEAVHGTSSRK